MPYGNTCRRKNGHCGTPPLCTARRTGRLWAARPYRSCCGPVPFPALWYLAAAGGGTPTFASFRSWLGRAPETPPDADRLLVRKFLHCHGPSTPALLAEWLGCSPAQARRLWNSVAQELEPVSVEGKARWFLSADRDALAHPCGPQERLILLGPHDPYLDTRDRDVLLPDKALQKLVWRTVGNPGAVVLDGRISGMWTARTVRDRLELSVTAWQAFSARQQSMLEIRAQEYAAFRGLSLLKYTLEDG